MPLYVYAVIEDDGSDGEVFEVLQGMSDAPLSVHPESGKPVRRLLAAPNTLRKAAPGNLSDSRLERLGFRKDRSKLNFAGFSPNRFFAGHPVSDRGCILRPTPRCGSKKSNKDQASRYYFNHGLGCLRTGRRLLKSFLYALVLFGCLLLV